MGIPYFSLAPGLNVSKLCLGTMTFGQQNCFQESCELLDRASAAGINFIDAAEMYPVPQHPNTQGKTEEYIGRWLRIRKLPRDHFVLATKVTGPSGQMTWIRDGPKSLDAYNIEEAIDNSLLRLGTDYIDLYQIHWPDRYVPMFGETEYDPTQQYAAVPIEEQLEALGRAFNAGKIRYVGVSNETPYGVMEFCRLAQLVPHYPRIVSIQNVYNLLCRNFDAGLAECCHHERVRLLAYSPLAMGLLSGKYFAADGGPVDARFNVFKDFGIAIGKKQDDMQKGNHDTVYPRTVLLLQSRQGYLQIAKKYGINPVGLAIDNFPLTTQIFCIPDVGSWQGLFLTINELLTFVVVGHDL
ncbi:uncharacterized protein LOC131053546 isoform X7 [Cryptomeria japonica]|uniref:uncharacterized protein LOC131053546 isoform X7 n=1 Tax=Cryptomeria japonica TaxID=3369 RepID=UPI0027DA6571|nr:uncharacterized protein LOC131053546 isoform X7 [Cryptomeria japonica]